MPEFSSLPPKASQAVSPKIIQNNLQDLRKKSGASFAIKLLTENKNYPSQLVAGFRRVTQKMDIPSVTKIARAVFYGLGRLK